MGVCTSDFGPVPAADLGVPRGGRLLFDCLTVLQCTIAGRVVAASLSGLGFYCCHFSPDTGPSVFGQGGPLRRRALREAPLRSTAIGVGKTNR